MSRILLTVALVVGLAVSARAQITVSPIPRTLPDYTQLATVNSGAPASTACDEASETGRLYWDSTYDILYLCSGASGWAQSGAFLGDQTLVDAWGVALNAYPGKIRSGRLATSTYETGFRSYLQLNPTYAGKSSGGVAASFYSETVPSDSAIYSSIYGLQASATHTGSGTITHVEGLTGYVEIYGSGTTSTVRGIQGTANVSLTGSSSLGQGVLARIGTYNSGAITNSYSVYATTGLYNTSSIGTAYGVYVGFSKAAGATLTNAYGLVIGDVNAAATTNVAIQTGLGLVAFGDDVRLANGKALKTSTTAGDTLLLQAYDTDTGPAYTTLLTLTAGTTPTMVGKFADGSASAPSIGFLSDADTGFAYGGVGYIPFVANGVYVAGVVPGGIQFNASYTLGWSPGVYAAAANDLVLARETAATLQLGEDVNGSAVAQTIKAHDGVTGTDIAGANLTLAGGRGTGSGTPGSLIFQTSTALASGTTAQTLATRLTINSTGLVVDGTVSGASGISVLDAAYIYWANRGGLGSVNDGELRMVNSAVNGFTALNLGPPTGNTVNGTLTISKVQVTCTIATDTNCSGKGTATITTSTGIPAGSLVLGVDARVTTIIAGSDGIASWALGHAGDTDAWGAGLALAATTTTGIANFTVTSPPYFTSATNITFTGTGGKVIDSGVIKITIYYIALTPISA